MVLSRGSCFRVVFKSDDAEDTDRLPDIGKRYVCIGRLIQHGEHAILKITLREKWHGPGIAILPEAGKKFRAGLDGQPQVLGEGVANRVVHAGLHGQEFTERKERHSDGNKAAGKIPNSSPQNQRR